MTHRFPIKELAGQAGLSTATVDRVLNARPNVSPQTRARVMAAINELEGQEKQLAARGRRMFVDIVVEAPTRFSREIRMAAEAILPGIGPATIRPRFTFSETMEEQQALAILARIAKRGSHGVCIKMRDLPRIRRAISELASRGIPVVTVFTDIAAPERLGYFGLDNLNAGRSAAYLMAQTLRGATGVVLTTQSQASFAGEEARARGFAQVLASLCPGLRIVEVSGGGGLATDTAQAVALRLGDEHLHGVYSMGGGNAAIVRLLAQQGRHPSIYIAHDLDADNKALLRQGKLTYVLHHDLRQDLRHAFLRIAAHHRLLPADLGVCLAEAQIITPMNMPAQM